MSHPVTPYSMAKNKSKKDRRILVRVDEDQHRSLKDVVKMGFSSESEVLRVALEALVKSTSKEAA